MSLPITSILAGFLALLLVVLYNRVISARYKTPDSDEDKKKLEETVERRIRGQANLVEYGPMALILFALLEMQAVNMLFLTVMAVLFTLWSMILVVWKKQKPFHMPQWTLFAIISVLAVIGMVN